jgi:UDP-4-amino-4,6-dideoxy-N-acetyl-beta-L-altrosamine transaminase
MIPYGRHQITQDDIDTVVNVLKGDWLTGGAAVEAFETELGRQVQANHTIACSNGTTALHLALLALGVGSGDVVLVPAITFLASANAARYVGADVVFVDVDPKTGLMTAETLSAAIMAHKDKNLKAVVNVHLAGQVEKLKEIATVARKHNLKIIEDAAHAVGSVYTIDGTCYPVGANAFSDITTFSFHPVKTIAMGEGGAITTNDDALAKMMRLARSHGMVRHASEWLNDGETGAWYYEMHDLGYNYRVSDINCALGLSQLKKLVTFKAQRQAMVDFYNQAFSANNIVQQIHHHEWSETAWHLYPVLIDFDQLGITRAELMEYLKKLGIGTQVHYIPLTHQPYYKALYGEIMLPGAEAYYAKCLSLPLYVGVTRDDQQAVVDALTSFCGEKF